MTAEKAPSNYQPVEAWPEMSIDQFRIMVLGIASEEARNGRGHQYAHAICASLDAMDGLLSMVKHFAQINPEFSIEAHVQNHQEETQEILAGYKKRFSASRDAQDRLKEAGEAIAEDATNVVNQLFKKILGEGTVQIFPPPEEGLPRVQDPGLN